MNKVIIIQVFLLAALLTLVNGKTCAEILQPARTGTGSRGLALNDSVAGCTVGNEESSPVYEVDFVQEQTEFAFLVEPPDLNCCEEGFIATSITFYLYIGTFSDMFSSVVQVGVRMAEEGTGGLEPGEEICVTPPLWILNCDILGLYTIKIPPYHSEIADLECPCLSGGSSYFLFGRIVTSDLYGAEPDAVRDASPVGGKSFVKRGEGPWEDVVQDLGWLGELVLHAEVTCCEEQVQNEETSWGQLKAIYR